jgi:hypothetical protein
MIGKIRSRLSSAHLIAVAALVFAVGGSVALANVPRNSVGTQKIKPNGVHFADLSNGLKNARNQVGQNAAAIAALQAGGGGAPPPGGVSGANVATSIGPNGAASIAAAGFRIEMRTDASANCDVLEITNTGSDGHFGTEDHSDSNTDVDNNLDNGDNVIITNLDDNHLNQVSAYHDNGSGGAVFDLLFEEENTRCVFTAQAQG